jgi:hypothetical protein
VFDIPLASFQVSPQTRVGVHGVRAGDQFRGVLEYLKS